MSTHGNKYRTYYLIGTDQAMAKSGNIQDDSFMADKQLGLFTVSKTGHLSEGDFLNSTNNPAGAAANTKSDAPKVMITQGTSTSADYTANYGDYLAEVPSYVKTGILEADKVDSYTLKKANWGSYSAHVVTSLDTPADLTKYGIKILYRSVRKDKTFGSNVDNYPITYTTPDLSALSLDSDTDYLITQLAYKANLYSKLVQKPDIRGNKNHFVFAVNVAGSNEGTAISAIKAGTKFEVMRINGTPIYYTATVQFVNTLKNIVDNTTLTGSSTIESIDIADAGDGEKAYATVTITNNTNIATDTITVNGTAYVEGTDFDAGATLAATATNLAAAINAGQTDVYARTNGAVVELFATDGGTGGNAYTLTYTDGGSAGATVSGATFSGGAAANKDAFFIIGLDHQEAVATDLVNFNRVRLQVELSDQFQEVVKPTKVEASHAKEDIGTAASLWVDYQRRAFGQTGTLQLAGFSDELITPYNSGLASATGLWTQCIIDFHATERTHTVEPYHQKRIVILLPATDDSSSATGATGVTVTTDASTVVADLEAIVKPWLASNSNLRLLGDATSSVYFA